MQQTFFLNTPKLSQQKIEWLNMKNDTKHLSPSEVRWSSPPEAIVSVKQDSSCQHSTNTEKARVPNSFMEIRWGLWQCKYPQINPPYTYTLCPLSPNFDPAAPSCLITIGDVWFSKCLPSVISLLPFVRWVSIVPFLKNKPLEMRAEERGLALRASIWHVNQQTSLDTPSKNGFNGWCLCSLLQHVSHVTSRQNTGLARHLLTVTLMSLCADCRGGVRERALSSSTSPFVKLRALSRHFNEFNSVYPAARRYWGYFISCNPARLGKFFLSQVSLSSLRIQHTSTALQLVQLRGNRGAEKQWETGLSVCLSVMWMCLHQTSNL